MSILPTRMQTINFLHRFKLVPTLLSLLVCTFLVLAGCEDEVIDQPQPAGPAPNRKSPANKPAQQAAKKNPKAKARTAQPAFVGKETIVETDAMLSMVPADTPYVWTSIGDQKNPTGIELQDWSPFYDTVANELQGSIAAHDAPLWVFATALLERSRGNYTVEGLETLGLVPSPRYAVYGIGAFPAARIEIGDPARVLSWIEGAERWSKVQPDFRNWKGTQIRLYENGSWRLALALTPNELLLAYAPELSLPIMYPLLFGTQPPEDNLATGGPLGSIALRLGDGDNIGFLELSKLARDFKGDDANSLGYRTLRSAGFKPPMLGEACTNEFSNIAAALPRIEWVGGSDQDGQWGTIGVSISDTAVLERLNGMRRSVEGLGWRDWDETPAAFAGLGLDVGAAIAWLEEGLTLQTESPWQCEAWLGLNETADQLRQFIDEMPEWTREVDGLFGMVTALEFSATGLSAIEGSLMIGHRDPEDLWPLIVAETLLAEEQMVNERVVFSGTPPGLPFLESMRVSARSRVLAISGGEGWRNTVKLLRLDEIPSAPLVEFGYDYGRLLDVYFDGTSDAVERSGVKVGESARQFSLFTMTMDTDDAGLQLRYQIDFEPDAGGETSEEEVAGDGNEESDTEDREASDEEQEDSSEVTDEKDEETKDGDDTSVPDENADKSDQPEEQEEDGSDGEATDESIEEVESDTGSEETDSEPAEDEANADQSDNAENDSPDAEAEGEGE